MQRCLRRARSQILKPPKMARPDESPLGNDLMTGAKLFQCVTGGGEKLEDGTPHGYFQFALPGHTPDLGRLS